MPTALFISRTDLVKNTILDGNVDTDKFIQFIKISQQFRHRFFAILAASMFDRHENIPLPAAAVSSSFQGY